MSRIAVHRLLARLRIGHTYLTQRYLLTRDPQPYCEDCLVQLTVRHLLVEWPSLIELRHRYLYRCRGRDSGVYYLSKVLGPACLAPGHDVYRCDSSCLKEGSLLRVQAQEIVDLLIILVLTTREETPAACATFLKMVVILETWSLEQQSLE
ncbi:hypothetical protein E2C01_061813 [Portunus trituberculatus]|uniref:Uncharacterized protein n=1 Tax=Portunus trituberculatus TaxID=210409 RepID=A0A5B7HC94_PORTR|nr:hypothetical protein [Portunus trituberculatus]